MLHEPLETAQLQAFVKIVELGSISRAAELLNIPRSTIARRLTILEDRLGHRLIIRTTRNLTVTEAGRTFYLHAVAALDAVTQAASSLIQEQEPRLLRGSLRVSVPPLNEPTLEAMLAKFVSMHPLVRLHLHTASVFVDLHRDDFDVAIRAGEVTGGNLISKTLLTSRLIAVASPGYLQQHGSPTCVDQLSAHRCLMGFRRGELPQNAWPRLDGGEVVLEGAFFSNSLSMLKTLALNDGGIATLPYTLVKDELASGKLIHILPDELGRDVRIVLLFKERELMPPQVRAFIDAASDWAKLISAAL